MTVAAVDCACRALNEHGDTFQEWWMRLCPVCLGIVAGPQLRPSWPLCECRPAEHEAEHAR